MNWTPLNLTVRVGCHLAYETTVQTPVLFVLKPRLEGKALVMQERLSFGIGLPSYEFQDSHGNITYRSTFMPGRNEIRHDALVAVSSLPDSREIFGGIIPVGQLPHELLRYTLPNYYAVLVNDTNQADANWLAYTGTNITVNLGSTGGVYYVWVGLRGLPANATQTWDTEDLQFTLDTTPPPLVIISPTNYVTTKPMLQLKGYSPEPLTSITFNVTNSQGAVASNQGLVTDQYIDTNLFDLTTNWFECLDVGLTLGTNYIFIQATDRAGNMSITNLIYIFDTNGDTTAPVIALTWPQDGMQIGGTNFTLRGCLDDETAIVTIQTVDANSTTNDFSGLVERDGRFWAENLPLSSGTNFVTISATDFAGNTSTTNLTLVQSAVSITVAPVSGDQLYQLTTTVTGTVSDPTCSVSVNGVSATVDGYGNWTATNAPVNKGTVACFDITANTAGQPTSNQSSTTTKSWYAYVQSYHLTYHGSVNYYHYARMLPVTESVSLNWTNGSGGVENYNTLDNFFLSNTVFIVDQTVWPADIWPPTLDGTVVELDAYGTNTSTVGPPSFNWESSDRTGTGYFFNVDDGQVESVDYDRTVKTIVRYYTGGKSLPLRQNLHCMNVTVNQQNYVWWFGGGSANNGAAITNGIIAGVFGTVGSDANAWKALADGQDVDITPTVSGVKNYNFVESPQKYTLTLTANGIDLSTNTPEFCVGQEVDMQATWSPGLPTGTQTSYLWVLSLDFLNSWMPPVTTDGSSYPTISGLTNSFLPTWWYGGGYKYNWCLITNVFSNGQKIALEGHADVSIYRPQVKFTDGTPAYPMLYGGYVELGDEGLAQGNMTFGAEITSKTNFPGTANWTQLNKRDVTGVSLAVTTDGQFWLDNSQFYNDGVGDDDPPTDVRPNSGTIHFKDAPGVSDVGGWLTITDSFQS